MPKGLRKFCYQFATVVGAVVAFVLQIQGMVRLSPGDSHGNYFAAFVMVECGGALAVLFVTLFRERARSLKQK